MSRVKEYIGPGIVTTAGVAAPELVADCKVVSLLFMSNKKPECLQWLNHTNPQGTRTDFAGFYNSVKGAEVGNQFECLLVCPDDDDADFNAVANAVPCPRLAKGDPMIRNLIQWHKVEDVPTLVVCAEDATEITADGVAEMDPPPAQQGG